jgi:nucleoside-diphosphate-sugar epimerase
MMPNTSLDDSVGVVTGASGFIGRALLAGLPSGCRVFATYHSATDFPAWASSCRANIIPVRIDLSAERLPSRVARVDWALLLAARVALATSRSDPVGDLHQIAAVAANSVVGLKTDRLVHMSSGSVYETLTGQLSPARVPAPRTPYGIAKLAAELLVGSYAEAPYWNVRFFGAFGPGEPSFKLARRLVEAFARGERTFEINGDGSNYIDPMFVADAVSVIAFLVARAGECRPIDLCQGEGLTVRQFIEVAYKAVHPDPEREPLVIKSTGEAHEQMRGTATSEAIELPLHRNKLTIAEGFRAYATELALR